MNRVPWPSPRVLSLWNRLRGRSKTFGPKIGSRSNQRLERGRATHKRVFFLMPRRCSDPPRTQPPAAPRLQRAAGLERLRAKGLLTARQIAELIESKPLLVDYWREM